MTSEKVQKHLDEQEKVTGATEKLRKLSGLKGKITQKAATLTKEHKFFTENTVCPTCTQSIEEDFRINKINDAQNVAKELQSGLQELDEAINEEQERERQFLALSKEISKLQNDISQDNVRISGCQRQIRSLESEVQKLPSNLQTEILNMSFRNLQRQLKNYIWRFSVKKGHDQLLRFFV